MRIAMLTNNYKPFVGGVPISIERLSAALRLLGHEVYIFAPTYEHQEKEDFVIRYRSFQKTLHDGTIIPYPFDFRIDQIFSSMSFDIIHAHHPNCIGWMALFAIFLSKKPFIVVKASYSHQFKLHKRWDQYTIPLPFGKIDFTFHHLGYITREDLKDYTHYQQKIIKAIGN